MNKRMLRSDIRSRRALLDRDDSAAKSLAIETAVVGLKEYRQANVVLLYASVRSEVRTFGLIETALAAGKTVALPRMDPRNTLSPRQVTDTAELERNSFGILEPTTEAPLVAPDEVDLAIVPGVAFDESCRRLGMGKGCYDRLLPQLDRATVVAVAFELQIVAGVPSDAHDRPVDIIVTEKRVIRRSQK